MFDYLQKFNNLPQSLREKVSSPAAMRAVSELEDKYRVDLAAVVMKIMAKTLSINDLIQHFVSEDNLTKEKANDLKEEMIKKVFAPVSEYLGLSGVKQAPEMSDVVSDLIKEIGLALPSEDLYPRLRSILITYLKGIRTKIDAKNSLMKEVSFGGLGLSQEEADRVFKLIQKREDIKNNVNKEELKPEATKEEKPVELESVLADNDGPLDIEKEIKEQIDKIEKQDKQPEVRKIETEAKNISSKEKLDKIIMSAEANAAPLMFKKNDKKFLPAEEKEEFLPLPNKKEDEKPVLDAIKKEKAPEIKPDSSEIKKEELKIEEKHDSVKAPEIKAVNLSKKEEIKTEVKPETIKESVKEDVKEESIKEDKTTHKTTHFSFKRPSTSTSTKPKMDDIKPVAKVMSPIDELRFLNLTNFRRLGENSDASVLKVFNKIKLLEKDGYDKMVEGVKAWRQSEVNRLYIKIGQDAISKELNMKDVIEERKKNKLPYLTLEEINSIFRLNGRLSF